MNDGMDPAALQAVTEGMLKSRHVHGAILCVQNEDASFRFSGSCGELESSQRYLIASVTKLYVTAMMLMLQESGQLSFEDRLVSFFPQGDLAGLHTLNGVDHTEKITVAHLLSNTSGLADYFYYGQGQDKTAQGLLQGLDEAWPLERAIEAAKNSKPKFLPGQKGKVFYSDTNFRLLGKIIEIVSGQNIADVFEQKIFQPLSLQDTYFFHDPEDTSFAPLRYQEHRIHAPRYLASIDAEGGIVSTAEECMLFLKAFFGGVFFPQERLADLQRTWNMIYFPGQFHFGLGLEKLWVPRLLFPGRPVGDILGFWGQSGAFAFHNPQNKLYMTGTVNQLSGRGHGAAFRAILKSIRTFKENS